MPPLISVMMSVYNGSRFLEQAIRSILAQSLENFEFLIVNDGSTDQTPTILQNFASVDSRVKIFHQHNQGLTTSLNRLFERSQGEFIARMDADDISMPDRFFLQLEYLRNNPRCAAVGTGFLVIDEHSLPLAGEVIEDHKAKLRQVLLNGTRNPIKHGSVMLRRAHLANLTPLYRFRYGQDFDLWLRLLDQYDLGMVERILYCHRCHSGALQADPTVLSMRTAQRSANVAMHRDGVLFDNPTCQGIIDKIHETVKRTGAAPKFNKLWLEKRRAFIWGDFARLRELCSASNGNGRIKDFYALFAFLPQRLAWSLYAILIHLRNGLTGNRMLTAREIRCFDPASGIDRKTVRKSICLVSPFAGNSLTGGRKIGGGGAERQLAMIASGLADAGWEVHCIVAGNGAPEAPRNPRIRVWHAPFRYLGGSKSHLLDDGLSLLGIIRRSGARIIGIRNGGPYILSMLLVHKLLFGSKLVVWIQADHDIFPDYYYSNESTWLRRLPKRIYTRQLQLVDFLLAQTNEQQQAINKFVHKPSLLMPNLAGSPWAAQPPPQQPNLTDYVLWAGNPNQNKRANLVLELAGRLPYISFVIAMNPGSNGIMDDMSRRAETMRNITWLGSVPPCEMEAWFDAAGCLLNTSVMEGFPNTFLQAWSRGIAVVTAGVDPDGVIARHGLGFVVPVAGCSEKALDQLTWTLSQLMSDNSLRSTIGKSAKAYVARYHDVNTHVRHLSGSLESLETKCVQARSAYCRSTGGSW